MRIHAIDRAEPARGGRVRRLEMLAALLLLLAMIVPAQGVTPPQALAPARAYAAPSAPAGVCPHPPEGGGPADTLRIADTGNSRIQGFYAGSAGGAGDYFDPFGAPGSDDRQFSGPEGIAMNFAAVYFVADTGNHRVQILDRGNNLARKFGSFGSAPGQFNLPNAIAVDRGGNIYVLERGNHRIQKFDMNGSFIRQWGSLGSATGQFNTARGLAVSWADGSVYVADTGNNRIQKFSGDGAFLAAWTGFNQPWAVTAHPLDGSVYIADTGNNRVVHTNSAGSFHPTADVRTGLNQPKGIAAGVRHGVFVLNSGSRQLKLFSFNLSADLGTWNRDSGATAFNNATAIASDARGVEFNECIVRDFNVTIGGVSRPRRITVYYTKTNGMPSHRLSRDLDAERIAYWTELGWQRFLGYGLGESNQVRIEGDRKEMEIWAFDIGAMGLDGWCCGHFHYQINSGMVVGQVNSHTSGGNDYSLGEVAIHELFHAIQPHHYWIAPGEPAWSVEGGSGNAQDKFDDRVDALPTSRYMGLVNSYLGDQSRSDFRTISYPGALFWTYLEEQLAGATTTEPGYGIAAVKHYFETVAPSVHGLDAVDRVVRARSGGARSLESFWTDFTLANYLKEVGGASARYRYIDDNAAPYGDVPVSSSTLTTASAPINATQVVSPYSALYYRFVPAAGCNYIGFNVTSEQRIGITPLHVWNDNIVGNIERERFWGTRRAVTIRRYGDYPRERDGLGLALTGLSTASPTSIQARCVTPALSIVRPTSSRPIVAGPAAVDNPGSVVVYVAVSDPSYGPVRGLFNSNFQAQVGGEPAIITAAVPVDDLYALVVRLPRKESAGLYDLSVTLDTSISAVQSASLRYTSGIQENMLVIDTSGSMFSNNRMAAAREAAQLQITEMDVNAWAGLVTFSTTALLQRQLMDITVDPARSAIRNKVTALREGGWTAIVDGTNKALNEIEDRGVAGRGCGITLLTDGMENQSTPAQQTALLNRLGSHARHCTVYAIALGPDADHSLLQRMVDRTDGALYASSLSSSGGMAMDTADTSAISALPTAESLRASWQNRLASFFDDIAARQAGRERVHVGASSSAGSSVEEVPIDASVSEALFAVNGAASDIKNFNLIDPDGILIGDSYPDLISRQTNTTHWVIRIKNPKPGTWKIVLSQVSSGGYVTMTSAETPVRLDLLARPPELDAVTGYRVPIIGVLHGKDGPIPGADVQADVEGSDGATTHLQLFDDGLHEDGQPDDGVYGNWFTRANAAPCRFDQEKQGGPFCHNAYQVYGVASMSHPTLGELRREAQTAFAIRPGDDTDIDGLPDAWEQEHGLNPLDGGDASGDPDGDGLNNLGEYVAGTDPRDADSDDGGESDGSEAARGADPHSRADDAAPPLYHIELFPLDRALRVIYGTHSSYSRYRILRRLLLPSGMAADTQADPLDWVVVTEQADASGVYTDSQQIANGSTYQYRVVPINEQGQQPISGAPLESPPATPGEDLDAPDGWLRIDGGAGSTLDRLVRLSLGWEPDALEMRIGNGPDLSGRPWQPLAAELDWDLGQELEPGQTAWVYVEFRDRAGNVGGFEEPTFAGIVLSAGGKVFLPLLRG